TFYHFTCDDHGLPGILDTKTLLPCKHPYFPHLGPLTWLTDIAEPKTAEQLGLTSDRLKCNRREWRIEIQTKAAVSCSSIRHRINPQVVADLELFGEPDHWWVVRRPLTASEISEPVQMAV